MLVFKTPLNGLHTVGCNQITKLRDRVSLSSAATIARKMAAVKSVFQHLHRQGEISSNPAANLGSPEVKKPLPRAISLDDIDTLIKQAAKRSTAEGLRDQAAASGVHGAGRQ